MWNYQNSDELYHHGILGMKWGVRRYQNKDGTYTSAGRRRYIKDKTSGITDKSKRSKISKSAGKKYDKVANKVNKRLADNDRRVGLYGKSNVRIANVANAGVMYLTGKAITRDIIRNGAARLRYMRTIPNMSQGKIKTTAALTLVGAAGVAGLTAATIKRGITDIRDTNRYDQRRINRMKSKNKKKK